MSEITDVVVPFLNVATFDGRRRPNVLMNPEIDTWCLNCKGEVNRQYLFGRSKDPTTFKVLFGFSNPADAVMFKLTFGGA
jgi:hypothetical protein